MADTVSATTQPPLPVPHVIIFPTPGMGHLIPLGEFAKRLVPKFSFTFAVPNDGTPSSTDRSFLSSLPVGIHSVFLPPTNLSIAPADAKIETLISLTAAGSLPSLRSLISDLTASGSHIVALVVDLFGTDALDVATELNLCPYVFFPTTATCLSLALYMEKLDQSCEYAELEEPVRIPGCFPLYESDLVDPIKDRKSDVYKWFVHHCKRYKLAEGIMVNSFQALEQGPISELLRPGPGKPPIYVVGPLIQAIDSADNDPSGCLKWLDEQPCGSVLYVNFGSGGTLNSEQQNELASGLEKSGQRFLWVVRTPNNSNANATSFSFDGQPNLLKSLPDEFQERTKDRGVVVPMWAPQIGVLSHGSTGGFLSHCGWNSTLESVVHGVPLIAWPLYAEQKMNALMLTKELKVGLRPKAGSDGVVRSDEIARVVKELMEGDEGKKIGARMKELKDAASVAVSEDGSSRKALKEITQKWEAKWYK